MSTQHTPGPWKAHAPGLSRSGLPEYQIHWSDIGECVAEVVHGTANAHLIAAAPELLDALQTMVKAFHTYAPKLDGAEYNCVLSAKAAIAKATGATHD